MTLSAPVRLFTAFGLLVAGSAASAELGGGAASIDVDRGRMGATLSHQVQGGFIRHVLTRPNGAVVHELTNAQGKVFAVTWAGPGKPDLRSLLGPYFGALQPTGGVGRALHGLRRPIQVARSDLRLQMEGHQGWFRGVALAPALAPAGFSTAQLQVQP